MWMFEIQSVGRRKFSGQQGALSVKILFLIFLLLYYSLLGVTYISSSTLATSPIRHFIPSLDFGAVFRGRKTRSVIATSTFYLWSASPYPNNWHIAKTFRFISAQLAQTFLMVFYLLNKLRSKIPVLHSAFIHTDNSHIHVEKLHKLFQY